MHSPTPIKKTASTVLAGSTPVDIIQLDSASCAWPVESDTDHSSPWAFCGLPVARKRYCAQHAAMAYYKPRS